MFGTVHCSVTVLRCYLHLRWHYFLVFLDFIIVTFTTLTIIVITIIVPLIMINIIKRERWEKLVDQ